MGFESAGTGLGTMLALRSCAGACNLEGGAGHTKICASERKPRGAETSTNSKHLVRRSRAEELGSPRIDSSTAAATGRPRHMMDKQSQSHLALGSAA